LTGATAGIGLAIAKRLLSANEQHLLILAGRNRDVLTQFEESYPDRVITSSGDMGDLEYARTVLPGVEVDERLDGLILNHGTLGNCSRITQMEAEEWEDVFRINVTSCVVLVSLSVGDLLFVGKRRANAWLPHIDKDCASISPFSVRQDHLHVVRRSSECILLLGSVRRFQGSSQSFDHDIEE
jgi:NAD(P)-dependent dehydrogenase (short-subunit alcohol dehydrogenase family)